MLLKPYAVLSKCLPTLESSCQRLGQQPRIVPAGNSLTEFAPISPLKIRQPPRDKRKVIVLTGPTAVGKTRTSIELAKRLGGEIISADSVQVYKGLDVGSDKAPLEERCSIPHHLLDILEPQQDFSVGDFFPRARAVIAQVLKRGNIPIVVGGTGFYLRWLVHGRPQTPASDPRAAAQAQDILAKAWQHAAEAKGVSPEELLPEDRWEAGVQAVAAAGDPKAAERLRLEPNNYYRMQRMLQILLQTDCSLAEMDLDLTAPLDYDFRCFFLNSHRPTLLRRIDARCESMVTRGLLQEAKMLLDMGIPPNSNCASKSIGYRQAMLYLQQCSQDPECVSAHGLLQMVTEMQAASRQLSKSQLHWFRGDPMYQWIDAARPLDAIVTNIAASVQLDEHPGGNPGAGQLSKKDMTELRVYQPTFQELHGPALEHAVALAESLVLAKLK